MEWGGVLEAGRPASIEPLTHPWRLQVEHLHRPTGWASPGYLEIGHDGLITGVHAVAPVRWQPDEHVEGFVIPGIPDLHSHAFHRAIAGRTECRQPGGQDDLWTWRRAMYDFATKVGPDELRDIAAMVYLELLRGGSTQVGEFHYLHRDLGGRVLADPGTMAWALVDAASTVGIGLTLLPVLYRHGGIGAPLRPEQERFRLDVDEVVAVAAAARDRDDPLVTGGVAPHSLRATTTAEIRALLDAWRATGGGPVHIHVAERVEEVDECRARLGASPIRLLLDEVGLDRDWCLVHATHATTEELAGVAAAGSTVALCPMTEATLADGLFPLSAFTALGGRWGIGTDGHHTTDVATELRCLELGQRLREGRRNVVAASDGIRRHTGRALLDAALGTDASMDPVVGAPVGRIDVGARADLVVLDGRVPALAAHGPETVLDAWILSGGPSPVRHVMVGGRWRIRDGHHPAEDAVLARYRATLERMIGRG